MKPLTNLFVLVSFTMFSQYSYEATETFPFGQPNPEAPEQITDFEAMIGSCNCTSTRRNQEGTWTEPEAMTWTWKYILNGMVFKMKH